MSSYVANTDRDRSLMMEAIGIESLDELFAEIPPLLHRPSLDLPRPLSELEVWREMNEIAHLNTTINHFVSFLGAGAYNHFIPSVVGHITRRNEFYTSYTPYQAEVSQGVLQAMYEYQSMVCELMAMDVANSSMYDGASAMAEAAIMSCRVTGRDTVVVASSVHPEYREVLRTYAGGRGITVRETPLDAADLGKEDACLIVQQPNFFGFLEDLSGLAAEAHGVGALLVMLVDPISLGMLKPPGELGADIAVAEGQSLGNALNFGGPYLGLFTCAAKYLRQMPGRIIGASKDHEGRVGFVMTLQTREQHIRREKATSNICTNEALVALASAVYLAAMGKAGLNAVAEQCYHKAHYLASRIRGLPGFELVSNRPFFKEFTVRCPIQPAAVNDILLKQGIIGGYDASDLIDRGMILCTTELVRRGEMDKLVEALGAI
ncbi:MAG: aminomethyl-transferring glycine dehydrogenase subunit GcvPA [Dehalococcoidia bacterium]|nr:aminomethyl-transferring glycine dehydrogenase subunit GcvPA [Dehalococcoidia bacterium]